MGIEKRELGSNLTDQKKLGKGGEIMDILSQIPKFNIAELKEICKGINIDQIETELPKKIEEFDNELSIENFFIETEEDVNFIISLDKGSRWGKFRFKDKEGLIKYLESWRNGLALPKQLLKNTERMPLKSFLEIYKGATNKALDDEMFQDRFNG